MKTMKNLNQLALTLGLIWGCSFSGLAFTSAAKASVLNGGFEDGLDNWLTAGDVSSQGIFDNGPTEGDFQALLTTASTIRDDDFPAAVGTFNFSGKEPSPVGFSFDPQQELLEDFLGLPLGSLDPDFNNFVVAIEGSAIKQTITVEAGEQLQFDWNFLSNDNLRFSDFGDYAFVSLYSVGSPNDVMTIADLNSNLGPSVNTTFAQETGYQTYVSPVFSTAGDYVFSVGVVDVEDGNSTSALLLDNIQLKQVPESSSNLSLLILTAFIGLHYLVKQLFSRL